MGGGPDGVKGWSERNAEDGVGDFDGKALADSTLAGGVQHSTDLAEESLGGTISKGGSLSTGFSKLIKLGDRKSWGTMIDNACDWEH